MFAFQQKKANNTDSKPQQEQQTQQQQQPQRSILKTSPSELSISPNTVFVNKKSVQVPFPNMTLPLCNPAETSSSNYSTNSSINQDNMNNDGLWIRLHSDTGLVTLHREEGAHFPTIHPNCNAPASLEHVHILRGGGSGTAVFAGYHDDAGPLVMKHGGARDTLEVFSLAEIAAQLYQRSQAKASTKQGDQEPHADHQSAAAPAAAAAQFMQSCIPEFVGVFCSPYHLRDRGQEAWNTIRNPETLNRMVSNGLLDSAADEESSDESDGEDNHVPSPSLSKRISGGNLMKRSTSRSQGIGSKRRIIVRPGDEFGLEVFFRSVLFTIPDFDPEQGVIRHAGYDFLHRLAIELAEEQRINSWKVTLMQKTIGGPHAVNGAEVLTSGRLCDQLLVTVIQEFTTVIRHLQTLTKPQETAGLDVARAEYQSLLESKNVKTISKATDEFCGSALRKNFMPTTGRFAKLREFGENFRERELTLEPAERFPATFLGEVLKPGAIVNDVFLDSDTSVSALDRLQDAWLDVLENATCFANGSIDGDSTNTAATDRIWTCGLTDAGLHNTFLSEERGLELFDLGKPQLMPVPAFLTKFLMSFFHALGMEEVEETTGDAPGNATTLTWARRFQATGGKLTLTEETKALLPKVYEAFGKTVDHFVSNVFNNDERVRRLLIKYVVLQLLSDGAFCLLRWEEKGGGRERYGKQVKGVLQKWLWRSLWDLYIASDVYEKLLAV